MDNQIPQNFDPETQQEQPSITVDKVEEAAPQTGESQVFFNVMPKAGLKAGFVEPKVKIASVVSAEPPKASLKEKFRKFRWYIAAVGVVIFCAALYFVVNYIGGLGYKSQNLLVPNTPAKNQQTSAPAPAQQSDFTTPQDWRDKYFPNCTDASICGDAADPDKDGLTNAQEYKLGTDPNNPDSDQDGLADGDEVNVFASDPLNSHTANDPKHSDADFIKGGFNITTNKKMTADQIAAITAKMEQFGLHEPTLTTLSGVLASLYHYTPPAQNPVGTATSTPAATSTLPQLTGPAASSTLDQSVEAKQARDAQRSDAIKNLEIALVKYQTDNKTYPVANDFNVMYSAVKLYLKVATNPVDPINKPPYVYSYTSNATGADFSLSFYSEVAGQPISKNAADAVKDATDEQSAIYDNQRETDLESIRTALLLYSQNNVAGSQDYVFPTKDKYKTAIVPSYISVIPVDPKTGAGYDYEVSPTFNTFTLKTPLDNPSTGTTGYMCNQDSCQNY
jgi:Bacterial TSP3 repeat